MRHRSITGSGRERAQMLRSVYEENMRLTDRLREVDREEQRPARRGRVAALVAGALLVLAGFVYQEMGTASGARDAFASGREANAAILSVLRDVAAADPALEAELATPPDVSNVGALLAPGDVPLTNLLGLEVKTIVIDPGHGGHDPGTVGRQGTREKDLTLDVARRLKRRLEARGGLEVLMTRDRDEALTLRERVEFTNASEADLFLSLHINWLPDDDVAAIETYYFGTEADTAALRLAARENRHSDYTLSNFEDMIRRLGSTIKLQESRRLAAATQRSLYRNMRTVDDRVTSWGVKTAPFVVLLGVEAPSILAELACISNAAEEERLQTPAHREELAAFLEAGILDYLRQRQATAPTTNQANIHAQAHDRRTGSGGGERHERDGAPGTR